ncbi:MAG: cobalamin biosynthesis protein [Spirochaetales bacterium]|nr:cobalamin biosynthesis protein [Spirochaetales bacterium]
MNHKKVLLYCLNTDGKSSASIIKKRHPEYHLFYKEKGHDKPNFMADFFSQYQGIVFFCALGIALRFIAPHIKNKYSDPAVVVVDNGCRYAVSLLSGHEGGANHLAIHIASIIGAEAVITTATESQKNYVLGIGSIAGINKQTVIKVIKETMDKNGIPLKKVRLAATIPRKCHEPGIYQGLLELSIPLVSVREERIKTFGPAFTQTAALKHLLLPAVAEPCALLVSRQGQLVLPVQKSQGLTLAIAKETVGPL